MADSDVIRARRYRMHAAGDHSICRAASCDYAKSVFEQELKILEESAPAPIIENTFGPRGTRLYKGFAIYGKLGPIIEELLIEACHSADRLNKLDAYLKNHNDWLTVECVGEGDTEHTITIDKALAEARQQQIAFKAVMGEIRQQLAVRPADKGKADDTPAKPIGIAGIRDDLNAWRNTA